MHITQRNRDAGILGCAWVVLLLCAADCFRFACFASDVQLASVADAGLLSNGFRVSINSEGRIELFESKNEKLIASISAIDASEVKFATLMAKCNHKNHLLAIAVNVRRSYLLKIIKMTEGMPHEVIVDAFEYLKFWKQQLGEESLTGRYHLDEINWDFNELKIRVVGSISGGVSCETDNRIVYSINGDRMRFNVESSSMQLNR